MNKIMKYAAGLLMPGFLLVACSPEEFKGADPNGIPTIEGRTMSVVTDQETNTATFSLSGDFKGCYPVWYLDGTPYSILPTASYSSVNRGTHTLKVYMMNRNGMSQGFLSGNFTFDNTKIDFSPYFRKLCDKEWRIDYSEQGHMGCGEPGTDGSNWWSAAPSDKAAWGVYDDRISFSHAETDEAAKGTYTYNPGAGGTVYVNTGCSVFSEFNTNDGVDFMATVSSQTTSFSLIPGVFNGDDCVYLQFPAQTLLPYIPNDETYDDPFYRIEALTTNRLVLVCDNGGIAWRLVFTSKAEEKAFEGFDATSNFNIWKDVDYSMFFWYAPGWAQIADPGFTADGNDYTITLPEATTDQWQAQVAFKTSNISTTAAKNYDFSAIINSDKDLNGATVKLVMDGDDNVFYFADRIDLKAGEDYIFWKSDMPGIDMEKVNLFFDFGGCQAGTTINIRNIVLKDHADDDGTVLPNENDDPSKPVMDWDYESGANLWKSVDDGTLFNAFGYWFADNGWGELATQPVATHTGDTYEITLPEGMGGSQWQGQFHIDTKLTASAAKAYNFYMVMEADADCPGVTIKLTDSGDSNYFCEGRHDIKADEPFIFKLEAATLKDGADATAIRLFFDFGGSPAGTHVKISKIYFEEAVVLNYDDDSNLWKGVDNGTVGSSFGYWFADNGWAELPNQPVATHNADIYEITLPEGMGGSQWQGQFHIDTELTASAGNQYHFQLVMEADNDCPGVTIKLTDSGDSNFFCEGRHDISADEPFVYTLKYATLKDGNDATAIRLFFDFGGSPAGTKVKISKIVFKQAQ